jgi:hypothetical protein
VTTPPLQIAVIVPVRDGHRYLERALPALLATLPEDAEVIVSDDGSRDGSADLAQALGARVVRSAAATGPAAARNRGAGAASAPVLVFLDADCLVHADTLARLTAGFADPAVAAVFGSYDGAPAARTWISLYKNLAHHFVHQRSRPEASTFWAGCGAIRRASFEAIGGFDEAYVRPSIEDVELGYRLRAGGYQIRLVREAQVTHLKQWTLAGLVASDFRDRAVPWARLLRAGRGLPRDLNFTLRDRIATSLVALAGLTASAAFLAGPGPRPTVLLAAAVAAAGSVALDAPFVRFAARRVSWPFAVGAAGLHLLHRGSGLAGFVVGLGSPLIVGPRPPRSNPAPRVE